MKLKNMHEVLAVDIGTIWIRGCNVMYTDLNGTDHLVAGLIVSSTPPALIPGLMFVSGTHLKYYCASGHLHMLYINLKAGDSRDIGTLLVRSQSFGYINSEHNLVTGHCDSVCQEQCQETCESDCQDPCQICQSCNTCNTYCDIEQFW